MNDKKEGFNFEYILYIKDDTLGNNQAVTPYRVHTLRKAKICALFLRFKKFFLKDNKYLSIGYHVFDLDMKVGDDG